MNDKGYGWYLHYADLENPHYVKNGIDKKVIDQITALGRNGIECRFCYCPKEDGIPAKIRMSLPGGRDGISWPSLESLGSPRFLYVRRPRMVSSDLVRFLEQFKEQNPCALVLYEIPTYPYDNEMRKLWYLPALCKDRFHRNMLAPVVDRIVDLSGQPSIFGIPTIQVSNGIDLGRVAPRVAVGTEGIVEILCAANYEYWHGIDRMIMGLYEYLQRGNDRKVHLHLAGKGSQWEALKGLVSKLGLSNHVTFHGALSAEQLDRLYDRCTIGIECLGMHRRNGSDFISSSIKSREYIAKGLPFIYAGKIDVMDLDLSHYAYEVSHDDSPIDIGSVLDYHDMLYAHGQQKVIDAIRSLAIERVSIDHTFKGVIDALKTHQSKVAHVKGNVC